MIRLKPSKEPEQEASVSYAEGCETHLRAVQVAALPASARRGADATKHVSRIQKQSAHPPQSLHLTRLCYAREAWNMLERYEGLSKPDRPVTRVPCQPGPGTQLSLYSTHIH